MYGNLIRSQSWRWAPSSLMSTGAPTIVSMTNGHGLQGSGRCLYATVCMAGIRFSFHKFKVYLSLSTDRGYVGDFFDWRGKRSSIINGNLASQCVASLH
jgi:hypothetical protein